MYIYTRGSEYPRLAEPNLPLAPKLARLGLLLLLKATQWFAKDRIPIPATWLFLICREVPGTS